MALTAAGLLAACGGGDGGREAVAPPTSCSVADHQQWLGNYMNDWYFWYRLSPHPDAAAYADVESYFEALLYTGIDPAFPADRWSRSESTESFNRFYGEGSTLGYGVSVAGLEVEG
ncbi:MAG: peptidase S41, partial [Rubrivivax sp.]|nr:peptidase S41 [Rubrivivax sp.]MBP9910614.1 peptidase S41 [Rubrivivax sp.]